jgi:O-antigen ligase
MEAILAIAAVAALVWVAVVFFRGGLLGGCLAVVIAGGLFGHAFFHLETKPVPLTADRVLWVVLLAQYVIWRRMGLADSKPWGRAELALAIFLGVLLVSTFTHDWKAHSGRPVAWLLFFYVMPVGVYWVARQARLTERGVFVAFAVLAAFGVYLAVTALAETHQLWWLVYPKYIVSADYREFLGRGRGPFLNPIDCGFYQAGGLLAALMWWPRLNRPGKVLMVFFAALLALGTYSTLTRSTWMGMGAALFVVGGLALPRSWRLPVLGAAVVAVALTAATQWDRFLAFQRDKGISPRATADSVELRPILARVAWKMFCHRPLLGCGFAQYEDQVAAYLSDRSTEMPLERARPYRQHNVFLSLLTETGLLGMGLFLIVLTQWGRDAWRLWRNVAAPPWARRQALFFLGMLGAYLPNAMFHEMWVIPACNMLLFLSAGLTAGLRPLARPAGASLGARRPASGLAQQMGGASAAQA